jgi:prefoldin subunit 5
MPSEQPNDSLETRLANRVEEALRAAEQLEHQLSAARARIRELEDELREAQSRKA